MDTLESWANIRSWLALVGQLFQVVGMFLLYTYVGVAGIDVSRCRGNWLVDRSHRRGFCFAITFPRAMV